MSDPVQLKAHKQRGDQEENEKLAVMFDNAAKRARAGMFKSVAWVGVSRNEGAAVFGWHKFGVMVPLIGAVSLLHQEMCSSPLYEIDDPLNEPPEEPA